MHVSELYVNERSGATTGRTGPRPGTRKGAGEGLNAR